MESIKHGSDVSSGELLFTALTYFRENDFSFALWRLPDSPTLFLAAAGQIQEWSEINLEESSPGFLFSPFNPAEKKIFVPADNLLTFEAGQLIYSHGSSLEGILQAKSHHLSRRKKGDQYHSSPQRKSSHHDDHYKDLVTKCREEILKGNFEKIVPSRTKEVELPADFDLLNAFNRLCELYPKAMVSIFSSPMTGTWVGATPEMLVSITRDQHFHTVALAGTQPYHEGADLRNITWTQKDIEEQALVERYIISCFKKIRLREYEEHGPKTIIAGNILHLKTHFDVDMVATNFPQLGSVMLKLLHPTSAVCGMPLDASLAFLKEHEGYDRQFYSGYLGPVNMDQESHLYVNLRCMQLSNTSATLFAGAGVLGDSDPEKEWHETEMKINTLGAIIRK